MDLRFRPMAADDFAGFYNACYPRDRNNTELKSVVESEWHTFFFLPGALSLLVEDRDRPVSERIVGCAQTVFVTDEFALRLRKSAAPWVNVVLTEELAKRPNSALTPAQIQVANGQDGVVGVMTRWMVADTAYPAPQCLILSDYLFRSFAHFSRGYKLQEIIVESIGTPAREEALRAGFRILDDYAAFYGDEEPPDYARPCLLHLTREDAWQSRGSLATLIFAYNPPRFGFGFNSREQTILRWALVGVDDKESATRIDRGLWTVQKSWQAIFNRVEMVAPSLLPEATTDKIKLGKRGDEKRRVLLRFLSEHPEELCAPENTSNSRTPFSN